MASEHLCEILAPSFEIRDLFLSETECDQLRTKIDNSPDSANYMDRDFKFNEWLPELSNMLADRIRPGCLGSGRITFIRYCPGSQGLSRHVDVIRENGVTHTGIIYLNDCDSGETIVYDQTNTVSRVRPRQGRLLLLPIQQPHAADAVATRKYVLLFRLIRCANEESAIFRQSPRDITA